MSDDDFAKTIQGNFYQKMLRNEMKNVQLRYRESYEGANIISRILEGSGIRVSDISEDDQDIKNCIIQEEGTVFSQTARAMSDFFHCPLRHGQSDVYDILFYIGNLDSKWEGEKSN
ncbi:hypothetical protein HGB07_04335 [Candidatus Roizmanbacteria bacterium]|nr:hypothetical protein [Candidatus Roizmanbacteria bacterium]